MTQTDITTDVSYQSHYIDIDGSRIHYLKEGEGDPILFLHGVPASSYVWRNIIPHLAGLGCCIAPDLMGFGKSDKPDITYTIEDHIYYIDKFIETLNLDKMVIVMHGWGSIIGFNYAMRHPEKCKGLVFYEAWLRPVQEFDLSLPYQEHILSLQEEDNTTDLVMNRMGFVNKMLQQSMMQRLSDQELDHYRRPFKLDGSGKPLFQYLNESPDGEKMNAVTKLIAEYSRKLTRSPLPKLMLYSVPGFVNTIVTAIWAKKNLPALEISEVGEELHFAQESDPALMGETISIWLQGIEQNHDQPL